MKILRAIGCWFFSLGLVLLVLSETAGTCWAQFPKENYRVDFASRGQIDRYWDEMTALDSKMLQKLEEVIKIGVGNSTVFSQIRECLLNTDSSVVILQAIQAIACIPSAPRSLVYEVSQLSSCDDVQIRLAVIRLLGWFAFSETFPAIFRLVSDNNLLVAQMAHSTLPRFGIESLAALPFIPKGERFVPEKRLFPSKFCQDPNLDGITIKYVITPNFRKFLCKIVACFISISSAGSGALIAYSAPITDKSQFKFTCVPLIKREQRAIRFAPALPQKDLDTVSPPPLHYRDAGLRLPQKQNINVRELVFHFTHLKNVFGTVGSFANIQIITESGMTNLVTATFVDTTVEKILNELVSSYSLKFSWSEGVLFISPSGK